MNNFERDIMHNLDERRASGDRPCETCSGTAWSWHTDEEFTICFDCLGQGITLSSVERQVVLKVAGLRTEDPTDEILDRSHFE